MYMMQAGCLGVSTIWKSLLLNLTGDASLKLGVQEVTRTQGQDILLSPCGSYMAVFSIPYTLSAIISLKKGEVVNSRNS